MCTSLLLSIYEVLAVPSTYDSVRRTPLL